MHWRKYKKKQTHVAFHSRSYILLFLIIHFRKDEDISVVFGAKNLKNYTGQLFRNVSIHKNKYDR